MKKVGIFFSANTSKSSKVGRLVSSKFGKTQTEEVNIESITENDFLKYDNYILGSSTWWDGELPNHWDEFRPALEDLDLSGKTFAFFGLGDAKKYPDNFGDAIGTLNDIVLACGGKVVGSATTEDFTFDSSAAVRDGRFVGAMIDEDNESDKTEARIDAWLPEVKKAFK